MLGQGALGEFALGEFASIAAPQVVIDLSDLVKRRKKKKTRTLLDEDSERHALENAFERIIEKQISVGPEVREEARQDRAAPIDFGPLAVRLLSLQLNTSALELELLKAIAREWEDNDEKDVEFLLLNS